MHHVVSISLAITRAGVYGVGFALLFRDSLRYADTRLGPLFRQLQGEEPQ